MRLSAWFAIIRCYGLNGYHYASHTTIAQESEKMNIQMSPRRAHFEKKVGFCFLGYDGEFNKAVKREAEKTLHNWKKEKKMSKVDDDAEDSVFEVETKKPEPTASAFQQTVDSIQSIVDENQQKILDLKEFSDKGQEERNKLLERVAEINQQLENCKLQMQLITEGLEYLNEAKKTFEKIQ